MMFHSMLEPEVEDDFVEMSDDEIARWFREHQSTRPTFAELGEFVPKVIESFAIAASVAPLTESPIEALFGAEAIKFYQATYKDHETMKFVRCGQAEEFSFAGDHTLLIPQYKWRNFRIDWVVKISFLKQPYFCIECDGREFHSSETQLLRDRVKDDAIKNAGMHIFRFSGSDLDRNPLACVKLVHSATKAQYEYEWKAGFHRQAG